MIRWSSTGWGSPSPPPTTSGSLDQNLRLDAYRLEFVTRSEAAAEVRGRLAVEYPEVDLDTFDDDEMVGMWAP